MNFSELHVDDFGAWHNLTLNDLSDGATIFYGPNEAGKTTLLNLIRTVLYGFSEKRCARYLPPARGNQAGGSLTVSDTSGRYSLHRSAPSHYRGGAGNLKITSPGGDKHASELLTTLLAGVDETIFNNVFAVGLTQMQQLATLSDTEAANQLYGLATGVDRVSLFDVTRELEAQRESLLPSLDSDTGQSQGSGRIDRLLDQRTRLQKELKALRRDEGHYTKLRREHRELTRQIKEKETTRRLLDGKGDWTELSSTIRKQWSTCQRINDRLSSIGPVADLPKQVVSRVSEIFDQVKRRRQEWEQLREERKRIKRKATKLKGRDTLYQFAAEIEALDRQRTRFISLEADVKECKAKVDELEFEMQAEMEELGLQTGTSAKKLPPISDQIIEALRVPAREARELREAVEALKQLAEDRRKQAEQVKLELESAAVRFGGEDISKILNRGVSLVQNLERRIDLDEHGEDLVRRLDEVQEEASYWQQRGILPWRGVLAVCGVFSAGAMLLLTGLLNSWFALADSSRLPMMLIGGSLAAVSLVIKGAFENSAEERAAFSRRQIELLQGEQEKAREECDELDVLLPTGKGHLDQRLIDARKEISQLDQFIPLDQQYQQLTREADAADHQTTLTVRQLKDSRRAWKASLRTVGLPESLTPTQVGQLTGRVGDVTRLRNQITEAKRELHDRQQELEAIRGRIEQLLIAGEILDAPDGLGPQLARLLAELEKHVKSGKHREELRVQWEELGEKQKRLSTAAQMLFQTRRQLLGAHGLTSARDFRDTQTRSSKAAKMRRERDHLLREIAEAAGEEFTVARLQKMLDKRSKALIERLSRLDRDRLSVGEQLTELRARNDQLKLKLDSQMQDRRSEQKELAVQVIDEKLRDAARQWHRSTLVSAVLDSVKQDYETKRQPVALAEASRHLERLTEGRYPRIWTPMGQSSLCIDDSHGTALPVEKLSRGTRELVFLALRLALVGSYNRRGANMPIVLDDVFVNFDDQRAKAATSVLADIAKSGQQMLIFTCHKRIRDIFSELEADVRDLPTRTGLALRSTPAPRDATKDVAEAEVTADAAPTLGTMDTTKVIVVKPELPVYDAESWDEAIDELASPLPEPVATGQSDQVVLPEAQQAERLPAGASGPAFRQVEPAWRDEWLEPLPDLADNDQP